MVVRHSTGTLAIEGNEVIGRLEGTRGLFRKEAWSEEKRLPLVSIQSVRVVENKEPFGVDLAFVIGDQLPTGFTHCEPQEAIEELLEVIVAANPGVTVNDVNVADEIAAREASDSEVIGVDRRVTLTRLALGGIVGGLLFKKRKAVRREDLR
jgi:hypothetical protein